MSEHEKKEVSLSLPGEWALQKAFGPVLTEMGEDLKRLYAAGRDRILAVGYGKIHNTDDGKQANLRVTRDVLWNGAFANDEVCAEYFGGILASSRSDDGKDDSTIQFVDVIKSLSSKQLCLHYLIYNCLQKILVVTKPNLNVGLSGEIQSCSIWLAAIELQSKFGINTGTDFNILYRQGLVSQYEIKQLAEGDKALPYAMVKPTTFGVLLYSCAHNRLDDWHAFSSTDFGNFQAIASPNFFADSLDELKKMAGMSQSQPATPPQL